MDSGIEINLKHRLFIDFKAKYLKIADAEGKLTAIKQLKGETGWGLKEAKAIFDDWYKEYVSKRSSHTYMVLSKVTVYGHNIESWDAEEFIKSQGQAGKGTVTSTEILSTHLIEKP